MTPTIVHRYAFPIRDAIETLLGDAVGDCEAWRIRVEGDEVVIDVVAPTPGLAPTLDDVTSLDKGGFGNGETQPSSSGKASNSKGYGYDSETSNETAKFNVSPQSTIDGAGEASVPECSIVQENAETQPDAAPDRQEPEIKGGPLARRAAIACSERGFWTFLGVDNTADAKADICTRCGITTRKMLDRDERAAAAWKDIDTKYGLWKEGYDVELDPVNSVDIGHE